MKNKTIKGRECLVFNTIINVTIGRVPSPLKCILVDSQITYSTILVHRMVLWNPC